MGFRPDAAASRRLTGLRGLLSLILACLAFSSPASALDSLSIETLCELVATAAQQQPAAQNATPIELATADSSLARETLRPPSSGWRVAIARWKTGKAALRFRHASCRLAGWSRPAGYDATPKVLSRRSNFWKETLPPSGTWNR